MDYITFANSGVMLLICAIPIIYVLVQSLLFIKKSYKRGIELGMKKEDLKTTIKSSSVFTIIPALPVVIFMVLLTPIIGSYFAWLRLSVIGSGTYEYLVATQTINALNLLSFNDLTMDTYVILMFIMTLSISAGILFSIFFLKGYSKKIMSSTNLEDSIIHSLIPKLYICLIVSLAAPIFFFVKKEIDGNIVNYLNLQQIIGFLGGFLAVIILQKIYLKTKLSVLKEFSFPLAILIGMIFVIIAAMLNIEGISL